MYMWMSSSEQKDKINQFLSEQWRIKHRAAVEQHRMDAI